VERFASNQVDQTHIVRIEKIKHIFPSVSPFSSVPPLGCMAICPCCHQETLRIITAITPAEVIKNILRHLNLAAVPSPIAPARSRQATFDWVA
jgi:hypothetical protein